MRLTTKHLIRKQAKHIAVTDPTCNITLVRLSDQVNAQIMSLFARLHEYAQAHMWRQIHVSMHITNSHCHLL
uniref:Uncharacterized protein n=1 Tax=Rhizophora mucronata TaxID=61149 RepID=A0A2P2LTS1_RHIMU